MIKKLEFLQLAFDNFVLWEKTKEHYSMPQLTLVKKTVCNKKDIEKQEAHLKQLRENEEQLSALCITNEWIIGGEAGGNCYNETTYAIQAEPKSDFIDLERLLENVCPSISFLQYKDLMRSGILHETTRTGYEYYGNHTEFAIEYVVLGELYDKLAEKILKFERENEKR